MKDIDTFKSPRPGKSVAPRIHPFPRNYTHNFTRLYEISIEKGIITVFSATCSYGHVSAAMQAKLLVQVVRDNGQVLQKNRASSSFRKEVISNSSAKDAPSCGRMSLCGLAGVLYVRVVTPASTPQHPCWPTHTQARRRTHARASTHTHTHTRARARIHTRAPPRAHTHAYANVRAYVRRRPHTRTKWIQASSIALLLD